MVRHIDCDIRDYEATKRAILAARPEFVFHLAAQALVRLSYAEPQRTFATNVLGSVNVLDAVRACPDARALVYITSDKCYLNKEWHGVIVKTTNWEDMILIRLRSLCRTGVPRVQRLVHDGARRLWGGRVRVPEM